MKRQPITTDGAHCGVYVADTYVFNNPHIAQKHLMPYRFSQQDYKVVHFPYKAFGRREAEVHLTETLMQECIQRRVPIVLETRTDIPDWALDALSQARHSVLTVQVATMHPTQRRRFFPQSDPPEVMRDLLARAFRRGIDTRLALTPLIPSVSDMGALTDYMNAMRAFVHSVEIAFGVLDTEDIARIERRNRLPAGALGALYTADLAGMHHLRDDVRERAILEFRAFCEGNGMALHEYGCGAPRAGDDEEAPTC